MAAHTENKQAQTKQLMDTANFEIWFCLIFINYSFLTTDGQSTRSEQVNDSDQIFKLNCQKNYMSPMKDGIFKFFIYKFHKENGEQ